MALQVSCSVIIIPVVSAGKRQTKHIKLIADNSG